MINNINTENKVFLSLKEYTYNILSKNFNVMDNFIQDDLKYNEINNGSKVFKIEGISYEIEKKAHVNCTLLETNGSEIFNLIIFPNDGNILPIFASEILLFGNRLFLAVIDIEMLWDNIEKTDFVNNKLSSFLEKYPLLPIIKDDVPEWAAEYFSKNYVYIRPLSNDYNKVIIELYKDYLNLYIELLNSVNLSINDHEKVNVYKKHHADFSPGGDYLKKIFGEDWAYSYINSFMYKVR